MKKELWKILPQRAQEAHAIADFLGLPPLAASVLAARGYGPESAKALLSCEDVLCDPLLMKDLDRAAQTVAETVADGGMICIYGDYDCDGVTSTVMLKHYFDAIGARSCYYIPHREREGYGLNIPAIDELHRLGVDLILTVDNGVTAVEEIAHAYSLGMRVVVTDHHRPGPRLPEAEAVVDPHRSDCGYPFKELSGVGVAFKLLCALEGEWGEALLEQYADLLAIGTVGDVVPLTGENRLFVTRGLGMLTESDRPGIRALLASAGLEGRVLNGDSIAFGLAPRINAAGRMDSPMDALELLLTMDARRAVQLAQMLDSHNRKRQEEEEAIRTDAVEMLHNSFDPERDNVIVLGSRAWHPGVVGIVASQLMRRYHKPTFVIAFDESGVGKGSGRSIPGVSLVQAIHHCADTLVSGGGHDMAAGLVIEESRMDDFRRAFNRYVSETTTEEQRSPVLNIDMEVSFQALTLDLLDSYEKLEPFGNSNPQPLFMSSDVFPTEPPKRVGTNHLKLFMRQGIVERDAIFFNGAERELPNPPWDIAFTIDRNVYRGRASLSISIQEIRSHREM